MQLRKIVKLSFSFTDDCNIYYVQYTYKNALYFFLKVQHNKKSDTNILS